MVFFGFSTTNALVSQLIRFFTRSKVSHAWLCFWDKSLKKYLVLEATFTGFILVPLENFIRSNQVVAVYTARPQLSEQIDMGLQQVASYLGTLYDFSNLLGFVWVCLLRWLGIKRRNPLGSPRKLVCSEAVARVLIYGNICSMEGLPPETTSPEDLMQFFEKSSLFQRCELPRHGKASVE